MTIYIDQNEPEEFDYLLTRMGIEVKRDSFNKTSETGAIFADFTIITESGTVSVNRKQAAEAMADLDKVEAQLMSELAACPKLIFMWEGFMAHHEDGTYAGDLRTITHKTGRGGNEYEELSSRGRVIHQPYVRWLSFQYKLQDAGIPVVGTGDVGGSAVFLAHLHSSHGNNLFTRLIATRQQVAEIDPEKRALALTLMGIQGARWGEEMSLALADYLTQMEMPLTLKSVMETAHPETLARVPLRSGKRVVGKAAAQRLFAALGY
jgi:hypothetical protein